MQRLGAQARHRSLNLRAWLLAALCGLAAAQAVAAAAPGTFTVTDDTGRPVALARPAARIVALAPGATALLGMSDKLSESELDDLEQMIAHARKEKRG